MRSDLWWCVPGFHSCTSPRQECVLTDAVACPCAFRGRWKNPGKVDTADASDCTLDQGGNSSRTRTEDQQLETAVPTWLGFCGENRQTVSTQWSTHTHTHTHTQTQTLSHTRDIRPGSSPNLWWWMYTVTTVYLLTEVIICSHDSPQTLNLLLCITDTAGRGHRGWWCMGEISC